METNTLREIDFSGWIHRNIYSGKLPTVEPELSGDFATLMSWQTILEDW